MGHLSHDTGGGGVTDHGDLTGLADDDHSQYATDAALTAHDGDTTNVHGIADTSVLATATDVADAVDDHEAAANPHPTYLTQAEGDALYAPLGGGGDGVGGLLPFGSGFDGDVTINSGTTTLTRDMAYNNLTINAGGILVTAGFRVQVKGTLSINATGALHNDGGSTTTTAGGTAAGIGSSSGLGGGAGGQAGGTTTGNAGGTLNSSLGGNGGSGGSGTSGAGGAAGTANHNITGGDGQFDAYHIGWNCRIPSSVSQLNPGGAAGGSGGGNGSLQGGGSGAGGGAMALAARTISNSGRISCNGGNGANGPGVNRGGGGGGGGGYLFIVYETLTGNAPQVNGGTGGTGGAGGGNGNDGANGRLVQIVNR